MFSRRHESNFSKPAGLLAGLAAVLAAVLFLVAAVPARSQPETSTATVDTADNFTGTILFIQGRPQRILPIPVGQLRSTAVSRLEAALRGRGHRSADRDVIEDLVMKWRIRGSHLVSREFLAELHDGHGVGQVLVATLLAGNGRFLMTTRMIDTATGRLTFVELADVDLPAWAGEVGPGEIQDWRVVLNGLCLGSVPPWRPAPDPGEEALLVLPTRGIASDPAITSAAAHSLLKTLLEEGQALIDPALVEVVMLAEGLPSHWLEARGRRILLKEFGMNSILASELVSYDRNVSLELVQTFDSDEIDLGKRNLTVFSLTMRTVDLETGTALRSAQIMHEKPPATGWFGRPVRTTLLQELDSTSHKLWAAFSPEAEDN